MSISVPKISASWPRWDWEASNGSATAAQTRASLASLLPMQRTDRFRHEVWNDLVDALNDVLAEAELPWDSTYTTAAGAKISSRGKLTAAKFNSVVYNILTPFSQLWMRWEYDEQAPEYSPFDEAGARGFLGRTEVRGKTETGDIYTADNVYGWYIYEVARRLNVLIEMLADDANWAELAGSETAKVLKEIFLSGDEARAMKIIDNIVSRSDPPLTSPPTAGLKHDAHEDMLRIGAELIGLTAYHSAALYRQGKMKMKVSDDFEMPKGIDVVLEARYAEIYLAIRAVAALAAAPSAVMAMLKSVIWATDTETALRADDSAALATDEKRHRFTPQMPEDTLLLARGKPFSLLWTAATILTGGLREITHGRTAALRQVERMAVTAVGAQEAVNIPGLPIEAELDAAIREAIDALMNRAAGRQISVRAWEMMGDGAEIESDTRTAINLLAAGLAKLLSSAAIDLDVETPGKPWYDPVQTGSNIYIRSVADPAQTGGNVYIGRE